MTTIAEKIKECDNCPYESEGLFTPAGSGPFCQSCYEDEMEYEFDSVECEYAY